MPNTSKDDEIKAVLFSMTDCKQISDDYWRRIAEAIADDVVSDIKETADPEWSRGDMLLAVGRALCNKLGIEY